MYYPKKIVAGLRHARHVFKGPGAWLPCTIVATIKANGSGFMKPLARLARGTWNPAAFETMAPSVTSKYCLVSSLLYVLYPADAVYILICGLLIAMKVAPIYQVDVDPFIKAEEKLSPAVFGSEVQQSKNEDEKKAN